MTAEQQAEGQGEKQDTENEVAPFSLFDNVSKLRGDLALEHLVDIVNETKTQVPIMLTVNGQTVFGQMINHIDWFDAAASVVEQIPVTGPNGPLEGGEAITAALGQFLRRFTSGPEPREVRAPEPAEQDDNEFDPPNFVHLTHARIVTGGRVIEAGLWRGRLTQISGWTLTDSLKMD